MSARLRRLTGRIARAALHRLDDTRRLSPAQRARLLEEAREDLAAMIDDAENRGTTGRVAGEMLVVRALIVWLEGGDPPGAEAIGYLERAVEVIPRGPEEGERAARNTYLAAIGELGGDEVSASGRWRDPVDEQTRVLLDFQGRKIRGRIDELGLTIGGLAERSDIDTVRLVAILFGREEMGAIEWTRLSEVLQVPLDWMVEGIRFLPRSGPEGRGHYEIGPGEGEMDSVHPADHPSDCRGGDPR